MFSLFSIILFFCSKKEEKENDIFLAPQWHLEKARVAIVRMKETRLSQELARKPREIRLEDVGPGYSANQPITKGLLAILTIVKNQPRPLVKNGDPIYGAMWHWLLACLLGLGFKHLHLCGCQFDFKNKKCPESKS